MTQRYTVQQLRRSLQQRLIAFGSGFELCIYITFFQAYVIAFVGNAHQPFNVVMCIHQPRDGIFADGPQNAAFQQLQTFYCRLLCNKAVKRRDEIGRKPKPVCYFFSVEVVIAAQRTVL